MDAPARKQTSSKLNLNIIIFIIALLMVAFHMYYSQSLFVDGTHYVNLHLAFALLIVFLCKIQDSKSRWMKALLTVMILLTVYSLGYVHFFKDELILRGWSPATTDIVIGMIIMVLVYYAAFLSFGYFIPLLVLAVMIYPFFGQYLPEPFTTISYPLKQTINNLVIGLNTGIYGIPLHASANYVFLFVVFGGIIGATGLQKFFQEFAKLIVGKIRGGSGLIAVVNSGMVGSISSSVLANISITGSYTIAAMKKEGYSAEQAAAIEATASNGGQIMPPLMGIIAFIMAGFAGIPYLTIVVMAIIPALLYFLTVFAYTYFTISKQYAKDKIKKEPLQQKPVDKKVLLYRLPSFVIPISLIIILLNMGYSVMYVAFWSILAVLVLAYLVPKSFWPSKESLLEGFVSGAKIGSQIGVITACVGILLTTFTGSGLGVKLSIGIELWSGGYLFGALLILWGVSILMGMIGVSSIAYIMAAAFGVPVLLSLAVPFEIAHFFVMFPTVFSALTPPVAIAVVVAAKLSNAKYIPATIESTKAACAAFIIPFLIIYAPSIVMFNSPTELKFWVEVGLSVLLLMCLQISLVGYLFTNINWWERISWGIVSLLFFLFLIHREPMLVFIGLVIMGVLGIFQFIKSRRSTINYEKTVKL